MAEQFELKGMELNEAKNEGKGKKKWRFQCKNGLPLDEAISALIKCTRRGMEYEAAYFAYCLHVSGFGKLLWRRLGLLAVEDVGLVNPLVPVIVNSLRESWRFNVKKISEPTLGDFLFPLQCVLFLCRQPKTREGDSLGNIIAEDYKAGKHLEPPEYAIDSHTRRGRKKYGAFGTGDMIANETRVKLWFDCWARIFPVGKKDLWKKQLQKRWGYPFRKTNFKAQNGAKNVSKRNS